MTNDKRILDGVFVRQRGEGSDAENVCLLGIMQDGMNFGWCFKGKSRR